MRKNGMALVLLAGSLAISGCGSSAAPAADPSSGMAPSVGAPAAAPGSTSKAQPQAQPQVVMPAPAPQAAATVVSAPKPDAKPAASSGGGSGGSGGTATVSGASGDGGGGASDPAPAVPTDGGAGGAYTVQGGMGYLANDFIVFASDRYPSAGNNDIYIYDTFQDTVLAVVGVNTYANEFNPRISDNGKWLVFQRDMGGVGYGCWGYYGQQDILMYGLQTKLVNTLKVLNTELYDEYMPDITNDGTKIVYVSDESGFPEVRLYDVVTGDNYVVPGASRNFADVTWPTISGNGLKIAYGASFLPGVGYRAFDGTGLPTGGANFTGGALYPGQSDIYVYDIVNGVQLTPPFINTAFDEYNPDLCADGSRILFVSNRLGTEDIFEVNLDTGFTDNLSFLNTYDLDEQAPRYLGGSIDRLVFQIKPIDAPYPTALRAYSRPAALLDTLPVANQLFSSSALRAPQPEVPAAL